jgi:chorismate mutase/prephenate dehydratase
MLAPNSSEIDSVWQSDPNVPVTIFEDDLAPDNKDFSGPLKRVAFQGERASFSHIGGKLALAAIDLEEGNRRSHLVSRPSFPEAISSFNSESVAELFLPIHNNSSGRVTDMHGWLSHIRGWIAHEYYFLVTQCLLVKPGVKMEEITTVYSQEPAVKQCFANIRSNKFKVVYTNDTAAAAKLVCNSKRRDIAAIASLEAGELYKLENLGPFNDHMVNYTRFLHFVHPSQIRRILRPRHEKCTTTFFLSGELYPGRGRSPFDVFSGNGVRVSRCEGVHPDFDSREAIIDVVGHNKADNVNDCFKELGRMGLKVRILGCYKTMEPI